MKRVKIEQAFDWLVVGPFANVERAGQRCGIDKCYPPEEAPFDREAVFAGRNREPVRWRPVQPCSNGFFELSQALAGTNGVAYVHVALTVRQAGVATVELVPYTGVKIFVNRKLVGRIEPPARDLYDVYAARRQDRQFRLPLRRGINDVLIKVEQGPAQQWGFFFRPVMARPALQQFMRSTAAQLTCRRSPPPHQAPAFKRWQRLTRRKLVTLMGFPRERIRPQIVWAQPADCGNYVRRHLYFTSEKGFWVPAYLLVPKDAKPDRSRKAMLALHGHGRGKNDVAGVPNSEIGLDITDYAYAHQYAEKGYVVMTIDSRGFGEISDLGCWAAASLANMIGRPLVGMRVWDAMRALDILAARPEVDPRRIGCTGCSWGGTHAAYVAMLDSRVKAALVSAYFSTFEDALYRMVNCLCQYLPGVAALADFPELLLGLVCPRHLYIQVGRQDVHYSPQEVQKAFRRSARVYDILKARSNVVLEHHAEGHVYRFDPAFRWFEKVL